MLKSCYGKYIPKHKDDVLSKCFNKPASTTLSFWNESYALTFQYREVYQKDNDIEDNLLGAQLSYYNEPNYTGNLQSL